MLLFLQDVLNDRKRMKCQVHVCVGVWTLHMALIKELRNYEYHIDRSLCYERVVGKRDFSFPFSVLSGVNLCMPCFSG